MNKKDFVDKLNKMNKPTWYIIASEMLNADVSKYPKIYKTLKEVSTFCMPGGLIGKEVIALIILQCKK